ncbi:alpha/beta hydrolase [Mycoplasma sp. P36-A1]|uniref:alpha/beta hydrolase n=1 Tax=Mycoplasma sp. P36-A1 TaxID=3252900 RepID=UPI003C2C9BDC
MKEDTKRKIPYFLFILSTIVSAIVTLLLKISPYPVTYLARSKVKPHARPDRSYKKNKKRVKVIEDVGYVSIHKFNLLDLYLPKNTQKKQPILLFIHGGCYIFGDKSESKYLATTFAAKGYNAVSMNYQIAPEGQYPAPLEQINEVILQLKKLEEIHPTLDTNNIVLVGDSAGAQLVAQYSALATNKKYQEFLNIKTIISEKELKGAMMLCGIFDFDSLFEQITSYEKVYFKVIGWAYTKNRNWYKSDFPSQVSIYNQISNKFPPSFLTDGNTRTYQKQTTKMIYNLNKNHVPNESLIFSEGMGTVYHNYFFVQFIPESRICINRMFQFLETYAPLK